MKPVQSCAVDEEGRCCKCGAKVYPEPPMTTERELEEAAKLACVAAIRNAWPDTIAGLYPIGGSSVDYKDAILALRALDAHRAAATDEALVERMGVAYEGDTLSGFRPAGLRAVLALLEAEGWKRP